MKVDIYTSACNGGKHLSVPAGTDVATLRFPADLDKELFTLCPAVKDFELDLSKSYIALDAKEVERQINANGYATHGTDVRITLHP